MPTEPPQHIGDVYRVLDYPFTGVVSYGLAYKGPQGTTQLRWGWKLEMDDGDIFPWNDTWGCWENLDATLVRRNERPAREVSP